MMRYTLAGFTTLGTLQSRAVEVAGESATVDATRSFAAADRIAEVEAPLEVWLDAQAYLVAAPSYLVPGMRRFGLSRFTTLGTLQSRASAVTGDEGTLVSTRTPFVAAARHVAVEGVEGTLAATRDPLVAATRHAEIDVLGGYQAGNSYALPDVSGGVSVMFEGVPGMTADIQFKRGSTLPVYPITLYRPDVPAEPLPLAGAAVRLVAKSRFTGATVIDEALEILDATTGLCQFSREVDEFHGDEVCKAEIVVTFGNGAVLILPTTGYYSLIIEDSLA